MKLLLFPLHRRRACDARPWRSSAAPPAAWSSAAAAPPTPPRRSATRPIAWARMTVAVTIGGQRSLSSFIVDTGAERTVISSELALTLGLGSAGDVTLASVVAGQPASRASSSPSSISAAAPCRGIQAPALAERNIGARACSASTACASQRVVFDFDRRELTLSSSPYRRRTAARPTRSSSAPAPGSAG